MASGTANPSQGSVRHYPVVFRLKLPNLKSNTNKLRLIHALIAIYLLCVCVWIDYDGCSHWYRFVAGASDCQKRTP